MKRRGARENKTNFVCKNKQQLLFTFSRYYTATDAIQVCFFLFQNYNTIQCHGFVYNNTLTSVIHRYELQIYLFVCTLSHYLVFRFFFWRICILVLSRKKKPRNETFNLFWKKRAIEQLRNAQFQVTLENGVVTWVSEISS